MSGVFVRWWKGVNHFIFLSNALTSEQNFHIVPHWVGFWKFIGVQPSQKIGTLVVYVYMPISFHFMRKRPGVKESSIDRVKLDSSFCVLMSPWRWQQEKFINLMIFDAFEWFSAIKFNNNNQKIFIVKRPLLILRLPALGNKYWIGCVLNFFNMEKKLWWDFNCLWYYCLRILYIVCRNFLLSGIK